MLSQSCRHKRHFLDISRHSSITHIQSEFQVTQDRSPSTRIYLKPLCGHLSLAGNTTTWPNKVLVSKLDSAIFYGALLLVHPGTVYIFVTLCGSYVYKMIDWILYAIQYTAIIVHQILSNSSSNPELYRQTKLGCIRAENRILKTKNKTTQKDTTNRVHVFVMYCISKIQSSHAHHDVPVQWHLNC